MDRQKYPSDLFTRQQISAMTGVNGSTLNYWSREGVLRAATGGGGKGSHRRFAYHQVTLAALLDELRSFGISMSSLARLADRFHAAFDWMRQHDISRDNLERIADAYLIQRRIVSQGAWTWQIRGHEDEEFFADVEKHHDRGVTWVELDWKRAVAHWFRPRANRGPDFYPTEAELAMVAKWSNMHDLDTYREHELYFRALTSINDRKPGEAITTSPYAFFRDSLGEWRMSASIDGDGRSPSFIGIDLELLTYRLWMTG